MKLNRNENKQIHRMIQQFHFYRMHAQSCPTLCDSLDRSPSASSVHGIFQARILEWVATSSSRGSSQPRDRTHVSCVSCIGRQIPYHFATWEVLNPPKMNYNKRDSGPAEPVEWKEPKLSRFLTILPSRSCSCRSTPGDKGYSACSVTSVVSDSL